MVPVDVLSLSQPPGTGLKLTHGGFGKQTKGIKHSFSIIPLKFITAKISAHEQS